MGGFTSTASITTVPYERLHRGGCTCSVRSLSTKLEREEETAEMLCHQRTTVRTCAQGGPIKAATHLRAEQRGKVKRGRRGTSHAESSEERMSVQTEELAHRSCGDCLSVNARAMMDARYSASTERTE